MEFNGSRCTSLFNIAKDPDQKVNLVAKGLPEKDKLEQFIKAYIQQYNNRLIENRMIIDN